MLPVTICCYEINFIVTSKSRALMKQLIVMDQLWHLVRKCCHWASTRSDRHQSDMPTPISGVYFIVKLLKKSFSCPNNNLGVTHQTDEKHLNDMSEYFVGVVNIALNRYNNRFVLCIINHYLLKYL